VALLHITTGDLAFALLGTQYSILGVGFLQRLLAVSALGAFVVL
jgi:hypothetical protein